MKIGILSDLHLGYRQYGLVDREFDFYQQFHKCCSKLNELDVEMVIIAGDIFDKPNPSPLALHEYRTGIESLGNKMIIAIKGNHTMLMKKNHYSVDEFFGEEDFGNYILLDDNSVTFENIRIDGITYRPDSQLEEFLYEQQELASEEGPYDCRILVTHQAYQEYCNFFGVDLSVYDLKLDSYDLIINGHIHSHDVGILKDTVMFLQPGSIERMSIAEASDELNIGKGVWVYDTNTKSVDFYKVESDRKFLQGDINIMSEHQLDSVFQKLIEKIDLLEQKPVVAFNYHDYFDKPQLIRDKILSISDKVLINNSNIYNKIEEEISIEIEDNEIPTVLEALNMVETDLSDDEKKLAIDIHQAFNNDANDIEDLLESYRKKHYNNKEEFIDLSNFDEEIKEYEDYFNNL